ncbi:MAG: hypothetical protein HQL22_12140 [Candidatus Omnitrophica bacterium]|nr:hypothetical protein [Candidatus Omnitrophota bacterium]
MNMPEIQTFINSLIYDLDTVGYLLDYGRIPESFSVMDKVLTRIESFHQQKGAAPYDLKDIFSDDFWAVKFRGELTLGDLRNKVREASRQEKDKALDDEEYIKFVKEVEAWAHTNIFKLKRRTRTSLQRKIEKILILSGAGLAVAGLIFYYARESFTQGWGVQAEFYEGRNFGRRVSSGVRKTIEVSSPSDFDKYVGPDNFSAKYSGFLKVPHSGDYLFTLEVDDGGRLIIDDQTIIDEWRCQGDRPSFSKNIFLTKGMHSIRVEYFQCDGPGLLDLFWTDEDGQKRIISADFLRLKKE